MLCMFRFCRLYIVMSLGGGHTATISAITSARTIVDLHLQLFHILCMHLTHKNCSEELYISSTKANLGCNNTHVQWFYITGPVPILHTVPVRKSSPGSSSVEMTTWRRSAAQKVKAIINSEEGQTWLISRWRSFSLPSVDEPEPEQLLHCFAASLHVYSCCKTVKLFVLAR